MFRYLLAAYLAAIAAIGVAFAVEEPIIPSGFTESAWVYSCPNETAGCPHKYSPEVAGDEGKLRFLCIPSHLSYEDPIVFPGVADATHLHQFYGNPHTNKDSTFATLRANVDQGSCSGGPLNNTGYWVPAMIRPQSNQVVPPDFVELYYNVLRGDLVDTTSGVCPGGNLQDGRPAACPMIKAQRLERGLKTIMGFRPSSGTFPLQGLPNFAWSCTDGSTPVDRRVLWDPTTPSNGVQNCPTTEKIGVRLEGPHCWDGTYDSSDHYSHLAYPGQDGYGGVICPATHPKRIPRLTLILQWTHAGQSDYSQWYLSSDRFNGATFRQGESFHADFYWAWSQNIMDAWNAEINGMYAAGIHVRSSVDGGLGNGTAMLQASIGIIPATRPHLAIPSRTHGYHRIRVNATP